jgi:hypothetical protein
MDRPRILRLLRIAFSVMCGILCLLLIVLWVRSYSSAGGWHTLTHIGADQIVFYESVNGDLRILSLDAFMAATLSHWQPGFVVPYWSLVSSFVMLAALPWVRWRFSLRTLLIATTLIAILLATAANLRLW